MRREWARVFLRSWLVPSSINDRLFCLSVAFAQAAPNLHRSGLRMETMKKARILIVDDDPNVVGMLRNFLARRV